MDPSVTTTPRFGSVEWFEETMRRFDSGSSSLHPFAIGLIQGVVGELHTDPATMVTQVRNALIALGRCAHRDGADPTGLNYGRGDEGSDPQPTAGRVPAHLEDGVTGQVEIVETAALKPECGAWCADGPGGLCMKDVGHAGEHGPQEAPALCLDLWHDADPLDSPDACPTCRDTD